MSKLDDFNFKVDCDISYIDENEKIKYYKWYNVWRNMIMRCYDSSNKDYKYYGAKGIYVSDEFRSLTSFKNWYLSMNPNLNLEMDKDILNKGYYGKDSIVFISKNNNIKEMRDRNSHKGELNPRFNDLTYYQTHSCFRFNFKILCKQRNLIFTDFQEIFDKRVICNNGKPRNKYFYIYTK